METDMIDVPFYPGDRFFIVQLGMVQVNPAVPQKALLRRLVLCLSRLSRRPTLFVIVQLREPCTLP